MFCEKCQKGFMPSGEEMNVPTGFRLEISQDHSKVTAYCNQCNSILREFTQSIPVLLGVPLSPPAASPIEATTSPSKSKARKAKV